MLTIRILRSPVPRLLLWWLLFVSSWICYQRPSSSALKRGTYYQEILVRISIPIIRICTHLLLCLFASLAIGCSGVIVFTAAARLLTASRDLQSHAMSKNHADQLRLKLIDTIMQLRSSCESILLPLRVKRLWTGQSPRHLKLQLPQPPYLEAWPCSAANFWLLLPPHLRADLQYFDNNVYRINKRTINRIQAILPFSCVIEARSSKEMKSLMVKCSAVFHLVCS